MAAALYAIFHAGTDEPLAIDVTKPNIEAALDRAIDDGVMQDGDKVRIHQMSEPIYKRYRQGRGLT